MRRPEWVVVGILVSCLGVLPAAFCADQSPLTLSELSAEDRGLLKTSGILGLRSPDMGDQSVVYNSKTDQNLTAQELEKIKKELRQTPVASVQGPSSMPSESKEAKELQAALDRGARGENIFEPKGPLPSSYSGYSLKGPALAGEGARVHGPGRTQVGVDLSAHNFLTKTADIGGRVTQKFEDHRVGLSVRRGLNTPIPIEVGGTLQVHDRSEGFLNGFISGAEKMLAHGFGPDMKNPNRMGPGALNETINDVSIGGSQSRENSSSGFQLGDIMLSAKAALTVPPPGSYIPIVAARAAVTIALPGPFSNGSSVGSGISIQQKLFSRLYAHGDARVTVPLESHDSRGLALKSANLGATVGLEYGITDNTSIGAQFNYQQSAYQATGMHPFDDDYTDVTFGISHAATLFARKVTFQIWGKEDVNLNTKGRGRGALAPHGDSDFAAGVGAKVDF